MGRVNFDSIKLDEKMLVKVNSGFGYSSLQYFEGIVTKLTKTRFDVSYNGRTTTFNKEDGSKYPRETGFSRTGYELQYLDDGGRTLIKRTEMVRKANSLAIKLHDIFNNSTYRNNIAKMDMSNEEVEGNIAILEQTYERFKKYTKVQE